MGGLGPNVWVWLLVKSHYLQVQHGSLGPERVNVVKPFITKITILWMLAIPSHGRFMARVWESQGSWKQVVFPPGKTSVCLVISHKSYSCFIQKQNGLMIQHHFKILQGWVVQAPSAVTLAGLGQHVEDWNCLWGSSSCKDRRGAHTQPDGSWSWVIMDKTWLSNAFQNHVYFRIRSKYTDKYSDQVFSTHERHHFKKAKNNNMSHMRFIRYLWFITQGFRAISGLTDCWRSLADERWRSRGKNVESLLAAYEVLTEDAEEVKGRRHFLEGIWW